MNPSVETDSAFCFFFMLYNFVFVLLFGSLFSLVADCLALFSLESGCKGRCKLVTFILGGTSEIYEI